MFEFIVVYPLALYGAYVLLGMPKTDVIVALGRKALDWAKSKING